MTQEVVGVSSNSQNNGKELYNPGILRSSALTSTLAPTGAKVHLIGTSGGVAVGRRQVVDWQRR